MKFVWTRILGVAGLALCLALPAAATDLTVVSNVTAGKHTSTSTTYLTADRHRSAGGDSDVIMEYATGRITMIDNKKKEYFVTSVDEMMARFADLAQQLDSNPMLKRLMGSADAVEVTKGAAPRTIAGHECDQYILTMGKSMKMDVWAARDIEVPAHYVDALKAPYAAMGPMGERFNKLFNEMRKIKGYPLSTALTFKFMGQGGESLTEATEVRQGPISPDVFAVPAGYKQKKSPFAK